MSLVISILGRGVGRKRTLSTVLFEAGCQRSALEWTFWHTDGRGVFYTHDLERVHPEGRSLIRMIPCWPAKSCRDNQSSGRRALVSPALQGPLVSGAEADNSFPPTAVMPTGLPADWSGPAAKRLPSLLFKALEPPPLETSMWCAFDYWYQASFLFIVLDQGRSFSTLKVYPAYVSHIGFDGVLPVAYLLAMHFMKGVRQPKPITRSLVPSWDLPTVLDTLYCS